MKYSQIGLTAFYHNYIAVPIKDSLRNTIKDFPESDKASHILTYGYINHTGELILEVLAAGVKNGNNFRFYDTNPNIRSKIHISSIIEDDC